MENEIFVHVPNDVFILIFQKLTIKELMTLDIVNKQINQIIRKNPWPHISIAIGEYELKYLDHIQNNYQFVKYDLSYTSITNLKILKRYHKLDLTGCINLTNISMDVSGSCDKLLLKDCYNLTNASVVKLGGCHTLDLSNCNQITDTVLSELKGCHTLNLSQCYQITDQGVIKLESCHNLNIYGCSVTIDCITKLQNRFQMEYLNYEMPGLERAHPVEFRCYDHVKYAYHGQIRWLK
jgi:hypothetical protein